MALSAALTIKDSTGSLIKFTKVSPVNDDSTFSGIKVGDSLQNGQSATQAMGNSSVVIAPKGCGADIQFVCQSNFEIGEVYLDIPAVGAHSFRYGNQDVFDYQTENPSGNNYTVTVSLKG